MNPSTTENNPVKKEIWCWAEFCRKRWSIRRSENQRAGLIYKESCLVNCDGWGFGSVQVQALVLGLSLVAFA
jgi:hypothetical protein